MGLCRKGENITVEKVLGLESFHLSVSLCSAIYSFYDLGQNVNHYESQSPSM